MTGPPGRPLRAGTSIVDILGGTFAVVGILAALRERDRTGKGQMVKSALYEAAVLLMGQHMAGMAVTGERSEEHTSELQSLMRISYAVFCLKKKNNKTNT